MTQCTTFTFLRLQGGAKKWWAFKQMQLGSKASSQVAGLTFHKLLGSGGKKGFSSWPNFTTYVLVCVWQSESYADDFMHHNSYFKSYINRSKESFTVYGQNAESHGQWSGNQPFQPSTKIAPEQPVLILTRATIRWNKLISFWRRVGRVSESLDDYSGLVISIGVGEWPLIQQATISLWKTQSEMLDYAYNNPKHREVVQLTRKLNWYKEELFARFVPKKIEGVWHGQDMAKSMDNL
jgi:hypothetical protein